MKKSVIAVLALSLMLFASVASANVIGIFGDAAGTSCSADAVIPYTYTTVYFNALLTDVVNMSACEFGATGVALPPGAAIATVAWNTTLVIGDIMTPDGAALAFSPPLTGPVAALGSIQYFLLTPALIPPNHLMSVVASGAGNLVVVDADSGAEVPADGWSLVMNCEVGGPFGQCECDDTIATEESSFSEVKALY